MRAVFAAGLLAGFLATGPTPAAAQAFAVTKLEAKHFFASSGRLSPNILSNGKSPAYVNAATGAKNLEGPTNSTLFVVVVNGPPGQAPENLAVRITIRAAGQFAVNRNYRPVRFNDGGNVYLGVLVEHSGCETLTAEAYVSAPREGAHLTGTVPFSCTKG